MKKYISIFTLLLAVPVWYSCGSDNENKEEESPVAAEKVVVEETSKTSALIFDCSSTSVTTTQLWPEAKGAIMAGKHDNKILLLVGPIFDGEIEKKGDTRAHDIALLFSEELEENQMGYAVRPGGDCETNKSDYYHEFRYKWVIRNDNITENFDHVNVYYEFDSDEEVVNVNVAAYIDELAAYLLETNESVTITGHTDADGTDEYNMELGMERAVEFKGRLIKRGVLEEQITVLSKGRSEPIASNETEEGRQLNRRIVVRISQK